MRLRARGWGPVAEGNGLQRLSMAVLLVAGCGPGPSQPPTPVIRAQPAAVCEGDDFETPIVLDGRRSSPDLDIVPSPPDPDAPPLEFRWRLEGADHRIVAGGLREPVLTVTTAGDRPLHVWLTVRTSDGAASTALLSVPIRIDCAGSTP